MYGRGDRLEYERRGYKFLNKKAKSSERHDKMREEKETTSTEALERKVNRYHGNQKSSEIITVLMTQGNHKAMAENMLCLTGELGIDIKTQAEVRYADISR